jgi:argininosuccinate lyase
MDPAAASLNASIDFDRRLLWDDVRGSQAHARMLAQVGLITEQDAASIATGLEQAAREIDRGEVALDAALEDIHMNLEKRLTDLVGEPARRLHTARSRNDQVCTDLKLYTLRTLAALVVDLDRTRLALVRKARAHASDLMPGYTHLQRAQAVTLGHHLMAYAEMLRRDRSRLLDAAARAAESPLGAGALAGSSLPSTAMRRPQPWAFPAGPRATA